MDELKIQLPYKLKYNYITLFFTFVKPKPAYNRKFIIIYNYSKKQPTKYLASMHYASPIPIFCMQLMNCVLQIMPNLTILIN